MPINYKIQKIIANTIIFVLVIGAIFLIKDIKYIQDLKNVIYSDTEDQVPPPTPPKLGGELDDIENVVSDEPDVVETQDVVSEDHDNVETQNLASEEGCNITNFGDQFICLLNEYRIAQGKSVVAKRGDLANVAQVHTDWMQVNNDLNHTGENGSNMTDRCKSAGITCAAENVAYGFLSSAHLLELWQNSPLHNENLLGNYTTVGLGSTDTYATLLLDF